MLVYALEQNMIVPIIDLDADQNGTRDFECFAQYWSDFVRRIDHVADGSERLGILDHVNRTELHTRHAFILSFLLNQHHVIGAIYPNHVNEVQL